MSPACSALLEDCLCPPLHALLEFFAHAVKVFERDCSFGKKLVEHIVHGRAREGAFHACHPPVLPDAPVELPEALGCWLGIIRQDPLVLMAEPPIACACHWGSSFRKSFQSDSFTPPDIIPPLFHLVRASQDAARPEASAMLCPPHALALSHAEVRADLFGQGIRAGVLPLPSRLGLCRSMDKSTKPSAAGDPSCQCLACYGETVQKRSLVFLAFLTRMDELWSCCFCRNPCVLCMSFLLASDHSELMCRQSRKCGSALIDR